MSMPGAGSGRSTGSIDRGSPARSYRTRATPPSRARAASGRQNLYQLVTAPSSRELGRRFDCRIARPHLTGYGGRMNKRAFHAIGICAALLAAAALGTLGAKPAPIGPSPAAVAGSPAAPARGLPDFTA